MPRRLILFGAFDRHNFGDLLLARCAAAAYPGREPVFAGLAARDLAACGGYRVRPLAEVIATYGDDAADFVHVGGELLTTTAWEAAVMLQTPDAAARAVAAYDRDADARRAWAQAVLGGTRRMPYVVDAAELPPAWEVRFNAVGGVGLKGLAPPEREEVRAALLHARAVTVRDIATRAAVARAGLVVDLAPDPATATPRRFATRIAHCATQGEVADIARRIPRWIAVQLAACRGDDATLDRFAALLLRHASRLDAGFVLFRAGLAPWHDDTETLLRLCARLRPRPAVLLRSAHVLDICAILRGACAYFGTSLHGWVVAHAFGVPARCLVESGTDKAAAYVDSWYRPGRYWRTLEPNRERPTAAQSG